VGPPRGHKLCQQTCSGVGSSLHQSAGPGRILLQHGLPRGHRYPPAPAWGLFHGLQVDICSIMDLHGLQGYNLPHHGLHHELQGKGLCSNILGTSFPSSFFTDLGVCRVVSFTLSHSSLYPAVSPPEFFLPFLKYVVTEALLPSLIGLALGSGGFVLEPGDTGFIRHGGSFQQFLTEATSIALWLPKHCHANP